MKRESVSTVIVLIALAATVAGQSQAQKRFTGGRVTLEDQGSFFIGGMTKVTELATPPGTPAGPPGAPAPPAPVPQQITIGQMYVQFQIPAKQSAPGWPVIMVHGSTHTAPRSNPRRMAAKAGIRTSSARAWRPMSSTNRDEDDRGSIRPFFTRPRPRRSPVIQKAPPISSPTSAESRTTARGRSGSAISSPPDRTSRTAR